MGQLPGIMDSGEISQRSMMGFGMAPPLLPSLMAGLSANPYTQQGFMALNQMGPAVANALVSPQTPILGAFTQGAMNRSMFMGAINQVAFPGGMGPGGMGFGGAQREQLFQFARGMSGGPGGPSMQELTQLVSMGAAGGEFTAARTVDQFKQKFTELLKSVKSVAQALGTSLQEGMQVLQQVGQMGFLGGAGGGAINRFQQLAYSAGMSPTALMGAAGGMIAPLRQAGGMMQGQAAMTAGGFLGTLGTAYSMGVLTDEQLQQSTGMTGGAGMQALMGAYLPRAAQRMRRSGRGSYLTAAMLDPETGQVDPGQIGRLMSGTLGADDVMGEAGQRAGQYGQANWVLNRGRLAGNVMEATGGLGEMMFYRNVLRQRGMGDLGSARSRLTLGRLMGASQEEVESFLPIMQNLDQIQTTQMIREAQGKVGESTSRQRGLMQSPQWLQSIQGRMQGIMGKIERTGEEMSRQLERAITDKYNQVIGVYEGWLDDSTIRNLFQGSAGTARIQQMGAVARGVYDTGAGGGPSAVRAGGSIEETANALRASWMGQGAYYGGGGGTVREEIQRGLQKYRSLSAGARVSLIERMQTVQGLAAPLAAEYVQGGGQAGPMGNIQNWADIAQGGVGLLDRASRAQGAERTGLTTQLGKLFMDRFGGGGMDISKFVTSTDLSDDRSMTERLRLLASQAQTGEYIYRGGDVNVTIGGRQVRVPAAMVGQLGRQVTAEEYVQEMEGPGTTISHTGRAITARQMNEAAWGILAQEDPRFKAVLKAAQGGFGGLGMGMLEILQGPAALAEAFGPGGTRQQQATGLHRYRESVGAQYFGGGTEGGQRFADFTQRMRGKGMTGIVNNLAALETIAKETSLTKEGKMSGAAYARALSTVQGQGPATNSGVFFEMLTSALGRELDEGTLTQIANDPEIAAKIRQGKFGDAFGMIAASGRLDQASQYHELGLVAANLFALGDSETVRNVREQYKNDPKVGYMLDTLGKISAQGTMDPAAFGETFRNIMNTVLMDPSKMNDRVAALAASGSPLAKEAGVAIGMYTEISGAKGGRQRLDVLRRIAEQRGVTGAGTMTAEALGRALSQQGAGAEADITAWIKGAKGGERWTAEQQKGLAVSTAEGIAGAAMGKAAEEGKAKETAKNEQIDIVAAGTAKALSEVSKDGFPVKIMGGISLSGDIKDGKVTLTETPQPKT